MAISLYDVSVASYLQALRAVEGFLEKGKTACAEKGVDLNEVVETRLYPDMMPFRFQLQSVAHHSLGTMKALETGEFRPPSGGDQADYAGLQQLVAQSRQAIEAYDKATVDAFEGKPVIFHIGGNQMPFTAENFVLSFSLPNVYFHAATAYDILRMKGVPVGKRDFMGRPRVNG